VDRLIPQQISLIFLKFIEVSGPSLDALARFFGILLSSVLNSDRAIKVNKQIIRIFAMMREMMLAHKDVVAQLEKMQNKLAEHDNNIFLILDFT